MTWTVNGDRHTVIVSMDYTIDLKDINNSHFIKFINQNTIEVTRESDKRKWTLERDDL